MSFTRKEFLRKGAASLGRAALDLAGLFREGAPPAVAAVAAEPAPKRGAHLVAQPQGGECFAGSCGCFTCLERCELQAIELVIGEGVRVDAARCNGCGVCVEVCPTTPRSLAMVPRPPDQEPAAETASS